MTREEWLQERRKGIGASDAAAVCGLSPWSTPFEVYAEKLGLAPEREMTEPMRWGLLHEPAIISEWIRRTGIDAKRPERERMVHPQIDFMAASFDFRAEDGCPVQCKTADKMAADDWGEPGSNEIPEYYAVQCQHEISVADAPRCYVPVLIGGNDFRYYVIERDQTIIDSLITIEGDFWRRVQERNPPEPTWTHPSTSLLIGRLYGVDEAQTVTLGDEALELVKAFEDHKAVIRAHEEGKSEAKAKLLHAIGEAHLAYLPDGRTITRKQITRKAYSVEESTYMDFRIRKAKVTA